MPTTSKPASHGPDRHREADVALSHDNELGHARSLGTRHWHNR